MSALLKSRAIPRYIWSELGVFILCTDKYVPCGRSLRFVDAMVVRCRSDLQLAVRKMIGIECLKYLHVQNSVWSTIYTICP